ncbi:MAG TPA: hypothetical protein VN577_02375 [Terriglobales bacterium]|nr:hypothetical protein [Terriglobales bacterium]
MRKSLLILIVALCQVLVAQMPAPVPGTDNTDTAPEITFTLNWPQAITPYYSISISSTGKASYQSSSKPSGEGDPYMLKFVASEPTRTKLFDLAKQVNYFKGDFNYKKGKLAFTGDKTLAFKDNHQRQQTSYVWSSNLQIQQITSIFQGISETIERGRSLAEKYRFDKLGVDSELKKMEEAAGDGRLEEIGAIQPILSRIAKDTSMMNITRRRAEALLAKIPKPNQSAGQP